MFEKGGEVRAGSHLAVGKRDGKGEDRADCVEMYRHRQDTTLASKNKM